MQSGVFFGVVLVFVNEIEAARLREIDLVGRDGKLAADRAPGLHVDLRSVERGFVRHFDKIDPGILEDVARHFFGLFPKLRFIDKLLIPLRRDGSCVEKRIRYFSIPKSLKYFRYISFTALNSASN